jgi:hypothetical protein
MSVHRTGVVLGGGDVKRHIGSAVDNVDSG